MGFTCDVAFTSKGFSNWKKAYFTDGGFAVHAKSPAHIQAYIAWQEFQSGRAKPAVVDLLSDERMRQINANRKYLSAVVDVLKFSAIHRLAQRGHDEHDDSVNRGNFLDLLNVIGKYNDDVGQKLESCPGNAKYTSKDMQNEILNVMASMVQSSIAQEVRDSGEFSILADETKDCRKMEQMSVVLRYFREGSIYESFVGFVQVSDLSAEGLSSKLTTQLQTLKVDYKTKLIGQGYDGASVMSGKNAGVAKLMQKEAPFALYVHCHAHRLNLALVDCVKSVPAAAEFFVLLEQLYVFVSGSFVHARWVEIQQEMYGSAHVRELQRLSDTRWACRYAACKAVRERLPALMQLLSYLAAGDNAKRAVEAKALLNALDCQFVLMLLFMCDVLGQTQSLSVMLQSTEINFSGPIDLLDVICASITECRSHDEHFCKVWSDAMNLCDSCGIEFTVDDSCNVATAAPPSRKRKLPTKFADSHVMQTLGDRPRTDSRDGF